MHAETRGFCGYSAPSWNVSPLVRGGSDCGGPETNLAYLSRYNIRATPGDAHDIFGG